MKTKKIRVEIHNAKEPEMRDLLAVLKRAGFDTEPLIGLASWDRDDYGYILTYDQSPAGYPEIQLGQSFAVPWSNGGGYSIYQMHNQELGAHALRHIADVEVCADGSMETTNWEEGK